MSWAKKLDDVLKSVNATKAGLSSDSEEEWTNVKRSSRVQNQNKKYTEADDSDDISDNFDDDPDDPDYAPHRPKENNEENYSSENEIDDPDVTTNDANEIPNSANGETVKNDAKPEMVANSDATVVDNEDDCDIIEVTNVVNEQNHPRILRMKRNEYNRNLLSTLILKSFKIVCSECVVMTSYLIYNDSLPAILNDKENANDNAKWELCALGHTYVSTIKDMVLIYGDINDPVYIDIIKKSIHNEKLNVVPDFFIDSAIKKIANTAMKKDKSLKFIGIPLNGRAFFNDNLESTRVLLYPIISKSSEKYLKLLSICNKENKHCTVSENCNENVSESNNVSGLSLSVLEQARTENKPKSSRKRKAVSEFYLKQQKALTTARSSNSFDGDSTVEPSSANFPATQSSSTDLPTSSSAINSELRLEPPSVPTSSELSFKPSGSTSPRSIPSCSNAESVLSEDNDSKALARITIINTSTSKIKIIEEKELPMIEPFLAKEGTEPFDSKVLADLQEAAKLVFDLNGPSTVTRKTLLNKEIIYSYKKKPNISP